MSADVECPRCARISFSWETNQSCAKCHWTIRPENVPDPYGYDVLIKIRNTNLTTTTAERHYKGNETTARRRARMVQGSAGVIAVVPLSKDQWLSAYGEGRM